MKIIKRPHLLPTIAAFLVAGVVMFGFVINPLVARADNFDDQINALSSANAQNQQAAQDFAVQAASYEDAIDKLQAQINSVQAAIAANQTKQADIKDQIAKAEADLAQQKQLLGENIKQMYLEGDMTTLEMLASSKDFSDFVDKQQYRTAVQDKIKTSLDKINALKTQLSDQETEVERLIKDQEAQNAQLGADRSKQSGMLAYTQGQRDAYNAQIGANNSKITDLRKEQAAENAKRFNGYTIVAGSNGRDTYPDAYRSAYQDSMVDRWGMYNRECVSYTAWKVYASGRYMPYGYGNANTWDDYARAAGYAVDGNPRAGDVAIAHWGSYGHSMYVESVNGDGTINISQYNWDYNGTYSEIYHFSASGLVFIHF